MILEIFLLLVLFQVKHFMADYPLQNGYMLKKFLSDWGFVLPLLSHAGVHAGFTLAICLWWAPNLWWLALVDLIIHFIMDRAKAGPKYLGRFKALSGAEFAEIAKSQAEEAPENNITEWFANKIIDADNNSRRIRHNKYFWWSLGLDQMVHHLAHYYIIFAIVSETMG